MAMWKCCGSYALVLAWAFVSVVETQDFGYGHSMHGPDHWSDNFKRCSGKHQSPINIEEAEVVLKDFPPLEYINFDAIPKNIQLTNNGHTVLVKMSFDEGKVPRIRGGPLAELSPVGYQFEQFHFHWGENSTLGSEDLINSKAFPAELHVVMRNLEYEDFASALGKDHGITVLALFFHIRSHNPNYDEFCDLLSMIDRKDKSVNYTKPLSLRSFLSVDMINYYSYIGSLTTPPCSEEVTWIDFLTPIDIAEEQINSFRQLTANDEHLNNNFRPIQPLNDRIIYSPRPDKSQGLMGAIPLVKPANKADRRTDYSWVALLSSLGLAYVFSGI